jgi:3-hydroxyacyl-[acyl-carrier-protein] dehydratase
LFAKTTGAGIDAGEFLVLGTINQMRFLVPVVPGNKLEIEVKVLKFIEGYALVEAEAKVDETVVAKGSLGFARRGLHATPPA